MPSARAANVPDGSRSKLRSHARVFHFIQPTDAFHIAILDIGFIHADSDISSRNIRLGK